MIRVLQVIGSMNRGGAENMIMNYYRRIDRTKVQFDFVEHCDDRAAFDDEIEALGGRIYRCPRYNGKNHFAYVRWWKNFFTQHNGEYPVVHGHLGSTAALYLSVARRCGCVTVAHSHNVRTQINIKEIAYALCAYPTRFIAQQLMACSRAAGISRYGKRRGGEERCMVVPNAVPCRRFAFDVPAREHMRGELHLEHALVIGHVGRFDQQKNHRFLLEIFRETVQREPSARLLLVGDGALRGELEHRIKDFGLQDKVIMTGVQRDVAPYYQAMDVFVFPSFYEGLPLTMVEAQTAGLPCVISDSVPGESILAEDLVEVCPLRASAALWAQRVLEQAKLPRCDHSEVICKCGYDIVQTARWLEEFYIDAAKRDK